MQPFKSPHDFHIPVMGLAYTIDSPIKVAQFGISSVVSIVQDNLIEKMRKHYYEVLGETYEQISSHVPDFRAKRISDYLNLLNRIVQKQMSDLRAGSFGKAGALEKYFEMLTEQHPLKRTYRIMVGMQDRMERERLEAKLKSALKPGSIDVNIMTKLDRPSRNKAGEEIQDGSDAVAAMRGYANSDLSDSTVVLSAGMNPRLFAYMEDLEAFQMDENAEFKKKIAIKVSDYRSALVQGKMLAKKGLWVSEFRIESGLNCGGHAFATDGFLLGPILEEFKSKRDELSQSLFQIYSESLREKGRAVLHDTPEMKITVQGGVGTHEEQDFLIQNYGVDSVGWGSPFLLVPEATAVDALTLGQLASSKEEDIVLSKNSPLGVRFNYLKGSTAELEKLKRIAKGRPGSPCTEKYLVNNNEFDMEGLCTASLTYQKKKLAELKSLGLNQEEYEKQKQEVLDKECLCVGLSNSAVHEYDLDPFKKRAEVNICPGPNMAYFSEVVSLQRMVNHIYGREDLLAGKDRPHMFIKELDLYVKYWQELVNEECWMEDGRQLKYVQKFYQNLLVSIEYYRSLADRNNENYAELGQAFTQGLEEAEVALKTYFELRLAEPEVV